MSLGLRAWGVAGREGSPKDSDFPQNMQQPARVQSISLPNPAELLLTKTTTDRRASA